MSNVIINADDLGKNQAVNKEVERLHQIGVLTSATVMATGDAVEEIPALQTRNPRLGLGVHLNASNFRALTQAARDSVLCDDDGVFHLDFRNRFKVGLTHILVEEWVAQVSLLRNMGVMLDHIDSHHHVHTFPPALPALLQVVKRTGLISVRNTRNLVPSAERMGLRARVKYSGKSCWSGLCSLAGFKMTTSFCSVTDVIHLLQEDRDRSFPQFMELMCHPGDAGNAEYVAETEWLESALLEWCGRDKSLMTYGALFQS